MKIATSVMNVTSVQMRSQGGCLTAASALSAQTEAPQGASSTAASTATKPPVESTGGGGGMSTGAKVGIIVAIAGGGAGAAIALAGHKGSTSP